eukprot:IDg4865t1
MGASHKPPLRKFLSGAQMLEFEHSRLIGVQAGPSIAFPGIAALGAGAGRKDSLSESSSLGSDAEEL